MSINKAHDYVDRSTQSRGQNLQDFENLTWRAFVTISQMLGCAGDLVSSQPCLESMHCLISVETSWGVPRPPRE